MLRMWDYQYKWQGRWYAGSFWTAADVDINWAYKYMLKRLDYAAHHTLTVFPTSVMQHLGMAGIQHRISARHAIARQKDGR